jgi:hypothetical protein
LQLIRHNARTSAKTIVLNNIEVQVIRSERDDGFRIDRILSLLSGVTVTVPEGAVRKGCAQTIFVAVLRDDKDRPKLSGGTYQAIEIEI